jgi:hypothetical protein
MDNLINRAETFFFNKALPVIFKGFEWMLGLTLLYSFILLVSNAINEAF